MKRYSAWLAGTLILLSGALWSEVPAVQSKLTLKVTPALYLMTDSWTEQPEGRPDFIRFYEYEALPQFATLSWKTEAGPVSTLFTLPLRKSFLAASGGLVPVHNAPLDRLMDLDTTFPFRGSIRIGGEYLSLTAARDSLRIGNGYWSPVTLNAEAPWFDYLQGSYDTGFFRLSQTLISLNPYLTPAERTRQDETQYFHNPDPESYRERVKTVSVHELAWRGDSWSFGFGEMLVIGGRSVQIQDAFPFLVFHNFYGEDWGNVVAFLNAEVRPLPGLSLYTDLSVDDLTAPTETESLEAPPPAIAGLLGLQAEIPVRQHDELLFVLEGVYVAPTFGMRGKPLQGLYSRQLYLDNTVGGARWWVDYPLCYSGGNDLIDGRTLISYRFRKGQRQSASLNLEYHLRAKGEESLHGVLGDEGSGIHHGMLPRGTVELRHRIGSGLLWFFMPDLSVQLQGSVSFVKNAEHRKGTDAVEGAFTLSVSRSFSW